jgi:phosphate acetyltransferase
MARSLYVTAMGPSSGKSVVTLGLMDLLSRRVGRVGFFRPVIRAGAGRDNDIELVRTRYTPEIAYEDCYALTSEQVRAMVGGGGSGEAAYEDALKAILARFKALEAKVDVVLCEGTDFTGVSAPHEAEFNATVARHLGTPVIVVLNGRQKSAADVASMLDLSLDSLDSESATPLVALVNRVEPDQVAELRTRCQRHPSGVPVFVVPEEPILDSPTLAELATALSANLVLGDRADLDRIVTSVKVAAMRLPNLLDHLEAGSALIVPGDRADVILGANAARSSDSFPAPVGLVLSGGLLPEPQVVRLVEGLRTRPLPMLSVELDTYETAAAVHAVESAVTPGNDRKITAALRVFEDNVDAAELERRMDVVRNQVVTPLMFEYELIERAKRERKHIVLPEGDDDRILEAADQLLRRNVCELTILGEEDRVLRRAADLGFDLSAAHLVNPTTSPWLDRFAQAYFDLRKHKGVTENLAQDIITDVSYFGTMMVHLGLADGMVSGAAHTTAHTIRPSLEFVKTKPGVSIVSSVFFMLLEDRVLVYGDCAVNPNPTATQLADIAVSSADTAQTFGVDPLVAMLSYSTGESGTGEEVEKVKEATQLARSRRPDLKIEGPLQYDAAVDVSVARKKLPGSEVAGHATVFVFPDLNTGNNTYKAVQRSAGAVAVGPVLQGLRKPVNDLSRGASVADIVNTVAITAVQAQES